MSLLVGTLTMGLLLALLTLGVLIALRVLHTLDLTVEGSFGVGAAIVAALLVRGAPPWAATLAAGAAGAVAGTITGVIHTRLRIDALLAGILTSTAAYSVMLYVMAGGDLSVATTNTLFSGVERLWGRVGPPELALGGATVSASGASALLLLAIAVPLLGVALSRFFATALGLAVRGAGDSPTMARAQGVNVGAMVVLGLALSNGLVGLAGALFAQYQGFANVQMAVGSFVTGLASLILGEALLGRLGVGRQVAGAIVGTVAYRLLVSAALRLGLEPNSLKLATAVLALLVLVFQGGVRRTLGGRRAPHP